MGRRDDRSDLAVVIHHVVEDLAEVASARGGITRMHDGADLPARTLLDIQATQGADEIGLRREAGDHASEALLHVPQDVTANTTSPAVERLYALYFYLP